MNPSASDAPLQRNKRERHLAWLIAIVLVALLATLAWMATEKPLTGPSAQVQHAHHD